MQMPGSPTQMFRPAGMLPAEQHARRMSELERVQRMDDRFLNPHLTTTRLPGMSPEVYEYLSGVQVKKSALQFNWPYNRNNGGQGAGGDQPAGIPRPKDADPANMSTSDMLRSAYAEAFRGVRDSTSFRRTMAHNQAVLAKRQFELQKTSQEFAQNQVKFNQMIALGEHEIDARNSDIADRREDRLLRSQIVGESEFATEAQLRLRDQQLRKGELNLNKREQAYREYRDKQPASRASSQSTSGRKPGDLSEVESYQLRRIDSMEKAIAKEMGDLQDRINKLNGSRREALENESRAAGGGSTRSVAGRASGVTQIDRDLSRAREQEAILRRKLEEVASRRSQIIGRAANPPRPPSPAPLSVAEGQAEWGSDVPEERYLTWRKLSASQKRAYLNALPESIKTGMSLVQSGIISLSPPDRDSIVKLIINYDLLVDRHGTEPVLNRFDQILMPR